MKYRLLLPGIATAIVVILYLPSFIWLVQSWLHDPYYRHGFIIPVLTGFLFWLRRDNLRTDMPTMVGIIPMSTGLILYIVAFIWKMQSLSAISFIIVLTGTLVYFCGIQRTKAFIFPSIFLIFMIPMPFIFSLSTHLQSIATSSSAGIARFFGMPLTVIGNQIELPVATFAVGTPCSGISSLISLLALASVLSFLLAGLLWKRAVFLLLAIPVAVLSNTIRLASVLAVANQWGADTAMNFFHTTSGIVLFLVAIVLLIVIARLLRFRTRTWKELAHG